MTTPDLQTRLYGEEMRLTDELRDVVTEIVALRNRETDLRQRLRDVRWQLAQAHEHDEGVMCEGSPSAPMLRVTSRCEDPA